MGRWRKYIAGMLCVVLLAQIVLPKLPVCEGIFWTLASAEETAEDETMQEENTEAGVREDGSIVVNAVNFPDMAFRYYVSSNFDKDADGVLSDDERYSVEEINRQNGVIFPGDSAETKITSLRGIEFFPYLEKIEVGWNNITEVDVSSNIFLRYLRLQGSWLKSLDLSNNPELRSLYCIGNGEIQELDLSKNPKLSDVTVADIPKVNVLSNTHLTRLSLDNVDISELDFANMPNLNELYLEDIKSLTSINLQNNRFLKKITIIACNSLQTLKLKNNPRLEQFSAREIGLTHLNLDSFAQLSTFYLSENVSERYFEDGIYDLSQFADFDVRRVSELTGAVLNDGKLIWDGEAGTIMYRYAVRGDEKKRFYIHPICKKTSTPLPSAKPEVTSKPIQVTSAPTAMPSKRPLIMPEDIPSFLEISESNFPDEVFRTYVKQFDKNESETLDVTERRAVRSVYIEGGVNVNGEKRKIQSLSGIEYFTELEYLNCDNNSIGQLDLRNNVKLKNIQCRKNRIKTIDISGVSELQTLNCSYNWLRRLDTSDNLKLTVLNCRYNERLSGLDISKSVVLEELDCFSTSVTCLDVSNCIKLRRLYCGQTSIHELSLTNNIELEYLDASLSTALEHLELRGLNKLKTILSESTDIHELDLQGCSSLSVLKCQYTYSLQKINLSGCEKLTKLYCRDCSLNALFLEGISNLQILDCRDNQLLYLNVDSNETMKSITAGGNTALVTIRNGNYDVTLKNMDVSKVFDIAGATIIDNRLIWNEESSVITYSYHINDTVFENFTMYLEYDVQSSPFGKYELLPEETTQPGIKEEVGIREDGSVALNAANFPDVAFRYYISKNFDKDENGYLDVDEIYSLAMISCYTGIKLPGENEISKITSVKGIEFFPYLDRLTIINNEITEMDLSANPLIYRLEIQDNPIRDLDLSNSPKLRELYCTGYGGIRKLDLSGNPMLMELDVRGISEINIEKNNRLVELCVVDAEMTEIDVSDKSGLNKLEIRQMDNLTDIDLYNNRKLQEITIDRSALQTLKLNNNPNLKSLKCTNSAIMTVSVIGCPKLTTIMCDKNCLTHVNLDEFASTESVSVKSNVSEIYFENKVFDLTNLAGFDICRMSQLTGASLDGTKLIWDGSSENITYMYRMREGMEKMFSIRPITEKPDQARRSVAPATSETVMSEKSSQITEISANVAAKKTLVLPEDIPEFLEISEDNFPDEAFRAYVETFDKDEDGALDGAERDAVTAIEISGGITMNGVKQKVQSLEGIEFFTNLKKLDCSSNMLHQLHLRNNKKVTGVYCASNRIDNIDVSDLLQLQVLSVSGNRLQKLDVSWNSQLRELYCSSNLLLPELDVSTNTALTYLNCGETLITSLDVRRNTKLKKLFCTESCIRELHLENNTEITELQVSRSYAMEEISLPREGKLKTLYCDYTSIRDLDLQECLALEELYIYGSINQVSNVENIIFGDNANLKIIDCSFCNLNTLSVQNLPALQTLKCANNNLQQLDLSSCEKLAALDCRGNRLRYLDTWENEKLKNINAGENAVVEQMRDGEYDVKWKGMDVAKISDIQGAEIGNDRVLWDGKNPKITYMYQMSENAAETFAIYPEQVWSPPTLPSPLPTKEPTPTMPVLTTETPTSSASLTTSNVTSTPPDVTSPLPVTTPILSDDASPSPDNTTATPDATSPAPVDTNPSTGTISPSAGTTSPSSGIIPLPTGIIQPPAGTDLKISLSAIRGLALSQDVNGKKIRIKWKKVAVKYSTHVEIYRSAKRSSGYKRIAKVSVKKSSYTDKKVKKNVTYYYKLRYVGNVNGTVVVSGYTKQKKFAVYGLKTPKIKVRKKRTGTGINYLEIHLRRTNGTYLQLYVKRKGKYRRVKLASDRRAYYCGVIRVQYVAKGKMYLRIRTGKRVKRKKRWSPWSNAVKIK